MLISEEVIQRETEDILLVLSFYLKFTLDDVRPLFLSAFLSVSDDVMEEISI